LRPKKKRYINKYKRWGSCGAWSVVRVSGWQRRAVWGAGTTPVEFTQIVFRAYSTSAKTKKKGQNGHIHGPEEVDNVSSEN